MTALFWKPGSAPHFGAFHHDLGFGLMHVADPARLPGKKVWTYGHGAHRRWSQATTEGELAYAEIESGPLAGSEREAPVPRRDRASPRGVLDPGAFPRRLRTPRPAGSRPAALAGSLAGMAALRLADRMGALRRRRRAAAGLRPSPPGWISRRPCGAPWSAATPHAAEPLALWLAFHGRPEEALPLVADSPRPGAQWIAGLILWKGLGDPASAVRHLEAGPLDDPVAVATLDELYEDLGRTDKRVPLLERAPEHRLIVERRANLALATGHPDETIRLLSTTPWPREHQRYVRTELWKKAKDRTRGSPRMQSRISSTKTTSHPSAPTGRTHETNPAPAHPPVRRLSGHAPRRWTIPEPRRERRTVPWRTGGRCSRTQPSAANGNSTRDGSPPSPWRTGTPGSR